VIHYGPVAAPLVAEALREIVDLNHLVFLSGKNGSTKAYLAAEMDLTCIVYPSSVPVTLTFWPANFSGVFWSLNS